MKTPPPEDISDTEDFQSNQPNSASTPPHQSQLHLHLNPSAMNSVNGTNHSRTATPHLNSSPPSSVHLPLTSSSCTSSTSLPPQPLNLHSTNVSLSSSDNSDLLNNNNNTIKKEENVDEDRKQSRSDEDTNREVSSAGAENLSKKMEVEDQKQMAVKVLKMLC